MDRDWDNWGPGWDPQQQRQPGSSHEDEARGAQEEGEEASSGGTAAKRRFSLGLLGKKIASAANNLGEAVARWVLAPRGAHPIAAATMPSVRPRSPVLLLLVCPLSSTWPLVLHPCRVAEQQLLLARSLRMQSCAPALRSCSARPPGRRERAWPKVGVVNVCWRCDRASRWCIFRCDNFAVASRCSTRLPNAHCPPMPPAGLQQGAGRIAAGPRTVQGILHKLQQVLACGW